jgi:hypothetical protein
MNFVILTATVVDLPRLKEGLSGTPKVSFRVESQTKTLPLRFLVLAFGALAESLDLQPGDWITVGGRMDPNLHDGKVVGLTILAHSVELLSQAPPTLAEVSR